MGMPDLLTAINPHSTGGEVTGDLKGDCCLLLLNCLLQAAGLCRYLFSGHVKRQGTRPPHLRCQGSSLAPAQTGC